MPFGQNGRVALRILGPLEVQDPSGREIRAVVAQPKRLALLCFLALTSLDQYRQRDTIVALFWPEFDQSRARGALRQALSWLRQRLGTAVLTTRGEEEIGVAASGLWCDVVAFDDAIATGDLERALGLYRGPLLEGVFVTGADAEFEHWLDAERTRRHQQATRAAIALAEREGAAGRMAVAVDWASRAAFLAPNDEDVHRRRLRLLAASGDRAGALAVHAAFVQRLNADFGTQPSAETARVVAELQASHGVAPSVVASPAPPIHHPSLTGATAPVPRVRLFRTSIPVIAVAALTLVGTLGSALVKWRLTGNSVATGNATNTPGRGRPPGELAPSRTSSPQAFELLLRAAFYQAKRTNEGFRQSLDLANQAIELDPLYADAHAVRAAAYQGYAWYGMMPANEAFQKSEAAARRAVAYDSGSALGHAMYASALSFFRYRWADGEAEFRLAVALDSSNAQIRNFYGIHLRSLGRFDEALEQLRRAQELDQLYRHYYYGAGFVQECAGHAAAAAAEYARALQYDSTYTGARLGLAGALARQGRYDDAMLELQRAFTITGDDEKVALRPSTGGEEGFGEMRRRIGEIDLARLTERAAGGYVSPTLFANALLATGNRARAIDELERAYAVRDPRLLYLICPDYAAVRDDPRVRAIRQRMNLQPGPVHD